MRIPRVSVEPGRSIAGPLMVTLYKVGAVKDANPAEGFVRHYVAVDGGMTDNTRPTLYGARYMATLTNRIPDTELVWSWTVGKYCESGDTVVWDVDLPSNVRANDLLVVLVMGAYEYSTVSNYNMLTKPGMITVEDGAAEWIMRPQTVENLLALNLGLS